MEFLTDENIAVSVVKFLRSKGHKVKDVKEEGLFGTDDFKLLEMAVKENRAIITHDKDFANISTNRSIGHNGIIILRLLNQSPSNVIEKLSAFLESDAVAKLRTSVVTIREYYIEIQSLS